MDDASSRIQDGSFSGSPREDLDNAYAQLGRALYLELKDDEKAYLEHPDLFYRISMLLEDEE